MAWRGPGGGREVLRLAWPLILSNSFWTLQITLDRVFLGWRSSNDTAACMAAAMLFWVPTTLLQYTVSYVTTFVAQFHGARQPERVGPVVWQAIILAVAGGLGFLLLLPLSESIIRWAGHDAQLRELETVYLRCLCFAALPYALTAALSGFFSGLGRTRVVMGLNAVGLLVNGVLGYLLIFGEGGFPELGIAGAGWATVCGGYVSSGLGLILLLRPENRMTYHTLRGLRLDLGLMGRLLRYGLPNGFMVMMETLGFTLVLTFIGRMGTVELAASTIAFTINIPAYLPTMGLAQAVGVAVGQRLGEGRPDLAERAVWSGLWLALAFVAVVSSAYVLAPGLLVGLFAEREPLLWGQVAPLAATLLHFVAAYAFFDAVALVFSFALRGAGDTVFVSIVSVLLSWPVMVLPAWLVSQRGEGLFVAWAGLSAFPVATALVLFVRFQQGKWRKLRVIETVAKTEGPGTPYAVPGPCSAVEPAEARG